MTPRRHMDLQVHRWVFAALASICLCGPVVAQKQGGSITVGLELDVTGFDPLKVGVYDTSGNMVAAALFDTLTGRDANGKATPKLALSWTHSEDYKTWTFKLRPGVKFHDGTPFTAQAVAGPLQPPARSGQRFAGRAYIAIEKVEARTS